MNAGAIAAVSLVPGDSHAAKWLFIRDGLAGFAGRDLSLSDEVYASASASANHGRNRTPSRGCCWPESLGRIYIGKRGASRRFS